MADYSDIPDYDDLPAVKGMPQGCAWGIFDKDGKKDNLGTINLITPEVVKAAVSEVKEGVSVSLKYASIGSPQRKKMLTLLLPAGPLEPSRLPALDAKVLYTRSSTSKTLHCRCTASMTRCANPILAKMPCIDACDSLNSTPNAVVNGTACVCQPCYHLDHQTDSSAGHFFHQPSACGYNGAQPTVEQLTQDFGKWDKEKSIPTLDRKPSVDSSYYFDSVIHTSQ